MGRRALAAAHQPVGFTMRMARKDVRLMLQTAGDPDALSVLPAVARSMDAAIEAGFGGEDFAVLADPDR